MKGNMDPESFTLLQEVRAGAKNRIVGNSNVYMNQMSLLYYSMGNCWTCYKVPPPVEHQLSVPVDKDKEEVAEVQSLFHRSSNMHRHSLSVLEHNINGNSRSLCNTNSTVTNVDNFGSLHRDKSLRTLYSRIQPNFCSTNNNEPKQVKEPSETKLLALFDQYKDMDCPNYIMADGIEKLLLDLNLSPDEFKVLVLAWRLNAQTMCQFSREEFLTGLRSMRSDSLKTISLRLPDLCHEVVSDAELFKDLYRFTFRFGLDKSSGQRILPSDMAVCLWRIVFSHREPAILDKWLRFLETHQHVRGIPKDTWNMFLNLTEAVGSDLTGYDDSEAWPSVFDDFVEYETDQTNQNISKEKDGT